MICENCSDVNCRFRNLIGDYCNDYKLKEKQMENKTVWYCTVCGSIDEPCIFVNPATDESPKLCPLKIDNSDWVTKVEYRRIYKR